MKNQWLVALCIGCIALSGCSGKITQEDYDALQSSYDIAESENSAYQAQVESLEAEKESLESELSQKAVDLESASQDLSQKATEFESLQNEYTAYKESMSVYEGLPVPESETPKAEEESKEESKEETKSDPTMGERNALSKADDYLSVMAFSRKGLIKQLEYEGFSNEEATYAVDNCGADWNEQAAKKAEEYLNVMSFSRSGLISQLKYEGFTKKQAEYGASAVGY